MEQPLVSVIIPTRNGNQTLLRAISSIYTQTYKKFEVIVVNDNDAGGVASKDLQELILKFQTEHIGSPVTLIDGKVKGPGIARDTGIKEAAKGELIAFLDDDDIWSNPNKLQLQVDYLDKNKDIKVTGAEFTIFINERGEQFRRITQPTSPTYAHEQMILRNPLITSSVVMYKDTYEKSGGFPHMYLAEDYALWLKIGHMYKPFPIANTPGTEISYTVRSASASNKRKIGIAFSVFFLVFKNFLFYPGSFQKLVKAKMPVFINLMKRIFTGK